MYRVVYQYRSYGMFDFDLPGDEWKKRVEQRKVRQDRFPWEKPVDMPTGWRQKLRDIEDDLRMGKEGPSEKGRYRRPLINPKRQILQAAEKVKGRLGLGRIKRALRRIPEAGKAGIILGGASLGALGLVAAADRVDRHFRRAR